MADSTQQHQRQQKIRARNTMMRAALADADGRSVSFEDLGHYQVHVTYSAWPDLFTPVSTWAAGLTCAGCGSFGELDRDHHCRECARSTRIRQAT